jgi:hypothetical protein
MDASDRELAENTSQENLTVKEKLKENKKRAQKR